MFETSKNNFLLSCGSQESSWKVKAAAELTRIYDQLERKLIPIPCRGYHADTNFTLSRSLSGLLMSCLYSQIPLQRISRLAERPLEYYSLMTPGFVTPLIFHRWWLR